MAPVIADLVAVLLYLYLAPLLTARLQVKSPSNLLLILGAYLLFCLSVLLMRKLEREGSTGEAFSTWALVGSAAFFGVFITYVMLESAGFFERLDRIDAAVQKPLGGVLLLVGAVLWLGLVFLYLAILIADIQASIPRDGWSYPYLCLLSLVGVNLMIVVTAAHWQATFANTEPYTDIALGGKILIFVLVYAFFLLFYAAPRLLFLSIQPRLLSVVTFLAQTGYIVWHNLSDTAW